MINFLKRFFSPSDSQLDENIKEQIEKLIELTIKGTDPRLSHVSGYKKKLKKPIMAALQYIDDIVEGMHPPLELGRRQYASDPQVHAFFGSANDIKDIAGHDRDLNNYLYKHVSEDETLYLGLAMRISSKNVLARKLVNGIVKKDVKRTAVNFSDHRFVEPSENEQELKRKVKERIFMTLIQASLIRLVGVKDQKHELEEQRSLLNAKLRNYKKQALGLEPVKHSDNNNDVSFSKLKTELSEIEDSLEHLSTNVITLDQYLDIVIEVMQNPSSYLKAENSSICVTRMNYTATKNDEEPGEEVFYTDFQANQNQVIGRLVKLTRDEIR